MNLNKKDMKNIMLLILFGVLVYVGIQKVDMIWLFLGGLLGIVYPFLLGAAMAFVLNVPMCFLEKKLFGCVKEGSKWKKMARPVSMLLSIVLVVGVILLVILVVVPELGQTILTISASVEAALPKVQSWAIDTFRNNTQIVQWIQSLEFDWNNIINTAVNFLKNGAGNVLSSTVEVARTVVNVLMNFFIGFVFAVYILLQKEKLSVQIKKVFYALFPERIVKKIMEVCSLSYRTFASFVSGQCVEAVILGSMFFITMTLFRFPYALLIGVLIAFTALIPVFGAFIGCVIGTFLIFVADPMKGLAFIVLFLVLQQIEGNLIYPHVVGNSVGLPSIWVLVAVTLGGSLMGVVGMLVFIPLSSVMYTLFRQFVYKRLKEKKIHDI
ncbi:MAG: AI-2E family transporter [Blautia sp.]